MLLLELASCLLIILSVSLYRQHCLLEASLSQAHNIFFLQAGKLSNVWFGNITSQSEAGIVISGHRGSIIENVFIKDTELELKKHTKLEGGFLDFRPSSDDVVNASPIPALFVEYVSHLELDKLEVDFHPCQHPQAFCLSRLQGLDLHVL